MRMTALALVVFAALAASARAADEPRPDAVALMAGDRLIVEYLFTKVPFKPYARHLRTPAGVDVIRDAPADHLHHHGLMFAWAVDGIDFWGETPGCGKQNHIEVRQEKNGMVESLAWVGGEPARALLLEQRRLRLHVSPDKDATLLTWRSEFALPADRDSAKISGSHYHGLGMRFVSPMDAKGTFINSENAPGEIFRGEERLVGAKWCAYASDIDGTPVTVALFDHPDNVRPATFFTMAKPFSYMSATIKPHAEALTLQKGKPLALTYGVAAWDGKPDPKRIAALYEAWLKEQK